MAKPIKAIRPLEISPEENRVQELKEIEAALATHKTAVLETLELLQGLHDRGVLPLLVGLLRAGDEVLAVLVDELNKPGTIRALRNLVGLFEAMGALEMEKLKPLLEGVHSGLPEKPVQPQKTGLLGVWKAMRDPEVNAGMATVLNILKGIGKAYGAGPEHEK